MNSSSRARRLLRDADRVLRRENRMDKRRSKMVNEIVDWCTQHDIDLGSRLTHDRLWFDADLLSQIDSTLAALGEPSIDTDLSGLTSAEQARHGSLEAKSRARDAARASGASQSVRRGTAAWLAARPRDFFDIDWRDITLDAFDALIQVETSTASTLSTRPFPH